MPDIREIDLDAAPDAVLYEVAQVRRVCSELMAPHEPAEPAEAAVAWLRHPPGDARVRVWAAGAAGEPVTGSALLIATPEGTGYVRLFVLPAQRRLGIARALLERVVAAGREQGLSVLSGTHADASGAGFAAAVGAREGKRNIRSVRAGAPPPEPVSVPGYRTVTWIGAAPEELLASFAATRNAINDAPRDEGVTGDVYTPERVRAFERSAAEQGRQVRVTAALDGGGAVIGFTELHVDPEPGSVASTDDTAVLPEHRGLGVARLVKTESLRLLAADRPDITRVVTTNAATNAPMLAVNRRLGFAPVTVWTGALLTVR